MEAERITLWLVMLVSQWFNGRAVFAGVPGSIPGFWPACPISAVWFEPRPTFPGFFHDWDIWPLGICNEIFFLGAFFSMFLVTRPRSFSVKSKKKKKKKKRRLMSKSIYKLFIWHRRRIVIGDGAHAQDLHVALAVDWTSSRLLRGGRRTFSFCEVWWKKMIGSTSQTICCSKSMMLAIHAHSSKLWANSNAVLRRSSGSILRASYAVWSRKTKATVPSVELANVDSADCNAVLLWQNLEVYLISEKNPCWRSSTWTRAKCGRRYCSLEPGPTWLLIVLGRQERLSWRPSTIRSQVGPGSRLGRRPLALCLTVMDGVREKKTRCCRSSVTKKHRR